MKDYKTSQAGEANPQTQPSAVDMLSGYKPQKMDDKSPGAGENANGSPYAEKGTGVSQHPKPPYVGGAYGSGG